MLIYNWGSDASRWNGLNERDRAIRGISDLDIFYKEICKHPETFKVEDYLACGENGEFNTHSTSWANTPSTGLALFKANQFKMLTVLAKGA